MSYDTTVLADTPWNYFKMAETSGTAGTDSGSHPISTTYTGATLNQTGIGDGLPSVLFAGSGGSSLHGAFGTEVAPAAPLSLECWVYQTAAQTGVGLIALDADSQFALVINSSGFPQLNVNDSNTIFFTVAGTSTLSQNAWHHIVGTFDGSTMIVYVDGAQVGAASHSIAFRSNADTGVAPQFAWSGGVAPWSGRMAKGAIYHSALSATRVLAHYNAQTSGATTTYPQSLSVSTAPTTVAKRQMAKAASGIQATSASISKLAGYARSLPASQASAPAITPNARLARTLAATQAGVNNYDAVILADSPTSFWKLNELSGTTAADASGTNIGTYSGGVTLNQPGMGDGKPSVLLDGSTGYITVPSATNLHPASSVSAECWVYPTVSPAAMALIASNAATTSYGYELGTGIVTNSGITPQFASKFSGGTNYGASSATYLTQNAWNHVVGTFDGTVMTVYINGVNVGSTTYGAFTMTYENNEFRIGRGSTATGQFFQGRIAKVAVYPVALTAAKVLAHYNAASNALGPIPATASGIKTATPLVRTFSTTQTSSTGAIKSPGKTLGLAQASIEAVSRQTKRTLGLTQVNSAMASRSSMRALSTLQASASGATKGLSRAISVGQASNVTATRSASRKFTVAEPSSAGLASGRAFLRSLAVTETSNSSITKTNQRTLSVPQVSGQVITRQNSRVLVIAQSSSETTKKTAARAMLVTEAGSVGVLHGGFFSKAFSATQSSTAAQTGRFQFNRTFSPSQGTFITLTAPAGRRVTLTLSQPSQASAVGTYFMPPRVIKGTVTRGRASQTHVGVQRQGFGGATH